MTNLREEDVYDVDERAYVRKAEVDEDLKQTRLQELKEQLAASESEEAAELRDCATKLKLSKRGLRISPASIQQKNSMPIHRQIGNALMS